MRDMDSLCHPYLHQSSLVESRIHVLVILSIESAFILGFKQEVSTRQSFCKSFHPLIINGVLPKSFQQKSLVRVSFHTVFHFQQKPLERVSLQQYSQLINKDSFLLGDNFPKRVKTPGKGQPPKQTKT